MLSRYRTAAKSLLRYCGIEARRYNHEYRLLNDAHYAQTALMGATGRVVVFDVGGHHGQTALRYASLLPDATVYSFEPSLESHQILSSAVRSQPRIRPFRLALSDRPGSVRFNINVDQRTNSVLPIVDGVPDVGVRMETAETLEVEATTVDAFCARENLDRIHILKMDVQGYEAPVIAGASQMLSCGRINLVYTEVTFLEIYAGQTRLVDLQAQLDRSGYSLFGFYNVVMKHGRPAWCDAIFVPPQIPE